MEDKRWAEVNALDHSTLAYGILFEGRDADPGSFHPGS